MVASSLANHGLLGSLASAESSEQGVGCRAVDEYGEVVNTGEEGVVVNTVGPRVRGYGWSEARVGG